MTTEVDDPALESLLEFLLESRGLDFTGYKRQSLSRRIAKRMEAVGASDFDEYRDILEAHADEPSHLVDTILINVTSFFRDAATWGYLADEIVPAIVSKCAPGEQIRVWSAGCATGEEAYGIAMVFAEHMGIEDFKARVKIFATDVDDGALARARSGVYTEKQTSGVPDEMLGRYFNSVPTGSAFRSDCRRSLIFGRNDVTIDAPISRLNLLLCRNVLMYLVAATQRRVLSRFHYAIGEHGTLVLGRAETILAHADLFDPVETTLRVFRPSTDAVGARSGTRTRPMGVLLGESRASDLEALALSATPVAQIVIDVDGRVVGANTKARAMLGVSEDDFGRPFWDHELSVRPIALRAHVEQAYSQAAPVELRDVSRDLADGRRQFLEISIAPLSDPSGLDLGVSITFSDVSDLGQMRADLERSREQLEGSNLNLITVNEELETSNEELQSTNEELETTNEELQSANEELETMNEELQSVNEELETMNEELIDTTGQIEQGERFLKSILDSLLVGVAVVDESLDVIVWNRAAENLFGLRSEEVVGRSFLALDISLPVGEVGPALHAALGDEHIHTDDLLLDAINRRGQPFTCRVGVQRLTESGALEDDVVVLMDPLPEPST